MIQKIIGRAKTAALIKKMRGGPQSLLPLSPGKGTGVKSMKGLTPKRKRTYAVSKQNPTFSLGGGLGKIRKGL